MILQPGFSLQTCNEPFLHYVGNHAHITREEVVRINQEWPEDGWTHKDGARSIKSFRTELTPTAARVVDRLTSPDGCKWVQRMLDIEHQLVADQERFGAGMHSIPRGGFLGMHVDFNQHPSGLWRRANLLIYLNDDWDWKWRGDLILADYQSDDKKAEPRTVSVVRPYGGQSVLFATTETSWHGHPDPLECPPERQRRSIAIYYYSVEAPSDAKDPHTTIYRKKREQKSA